MSQASREGATRHSSGLSAQPAALTQLRAQGSRKDVIWAGAFPGWAALGSVLGEVGERW